MWKRLKHPNIVPFIGVTRNPMQFVSEWMSNGTLRDYVNENPDANKIGLVSSLSVTTALLITSLFQVNGCGKRSYLSTCKSHCTRRSERGRCLTLEILSCIGNC